MNHSRYQPRDEPMERESAELIDARFKAALAIIKRTHQFSLDPWANIATCADEHRIAGMRGQTTRDHGQRAILQA